MKKGLKLYVIAGEASGDLHAGNLMTALLDEDNTIDFRYWGGDKMAAVQDGMVKHIKELAFMGFIEVLMNLRTILKNFRLCKKDIAKYKPDAIILVDYPGFNLRIAEWAKAQNIKVYYYISPQVWAWKQSRVHKIKKVVDHMFVILPFEKQFYKKFDFDVEYVGHPLLDEISKYDFSDSKSSFSQRYGLDERPIIAILPGSRKQEVSKKLPIMLEAVQDLSSHQVVIAGAPTLSSEFYASINDSVKIVNNETYALLANQDHLGTSASSGLCSPGHQRDQPARLSMRPLRTCPGSACLGSCAGGANDRGALFPRRSRDSLRACCPSWQPEDRAGDG